MLGVILKILRPRYALLGLLLFGGYQGYSILKSATEPLRSSGVAEQVQMGQVEPQSDEALLLNDGEEVSTIAGAIQDIHPVVRIASWLVIYGLLCLATVPIINRILRQESNLANGILVLTYVAVGVLLAFLFVAFRVDWIAIVFLVAAVIVSLLVIVRLASALEEGRIGHYSRAQRG